MMFVLMYVCMYDMIVIGFISKSDGDLIKTGFQSAKSVTMSAPVLFLDPNLNENHFSFFSSRGPTNGMYMVYSSISCYCYL